MTYYIYNTRLRLFGDGSESVEDELCPRLTGGQSERLQLLASQQPLWPQWPRGEDGGAGPVLAEALQRSEAVYSTPASSKQEAVSLDKMVSGRGRVPDTRPPLVEGRDPGHHQDHRHHQSHHHHGGAAHYKDDSELCQGRRSDQVITYLDPGSSDLDIRVFVCCGDIILALSADLE